MRIGISTLIILFSPFIELQAQVPTVEWFRGQGTSGEEHVHEGLQTSDGGYIAIGHGIDPDDDGDMMIIKVNEQGFFRWKREFGTMGKLGAGYCIAEISDGYIAGGGIFDPDSQRTQRFLAKLDLDGKIEWEKYYGSPGVGSIRGIDITDDSSIVVTGYVNAPDDPEFQGFVFIVDEGDGFIMKLDLEGNVIWEESVDAPQGTKVREIENGYAICSTVWTWTQAAGDNQDFRLLITDTLGITQDYYDYGGANGDHCYDFDITADGGYILAGHTTSYGVSNWDYLLLKIDNKGNEEWHKTFGQPRGYDDNFIHDEAYGVRQTPDGGYVICGGSGDESSYSASGHAAGPSDEWKVYLVKTDSSGETVWEGIYPGTSVGNNAGEYIDLSDDGGYIVFVDTDSQYPPTPNNFGFMKLSSDNSAGVESVSQRTVENFILYPNYPNPFNSQTIIPLQVAEASEMKIDLYNIRGEHITKVHQDFMVIGFHEIIVNSGHMPSGEYIIRIEGNGFVEMLKCVLLR